MITQRFFSGDRRIAVAILALLAAAAVVLLACGGAWAQVLNDPVDVSQEFQKMEPVYFVGSKVASFDPPTGRGTPSSAFFMAATSAAKMRPRAMSPKTNLPRSAGMRPL